MKKFNVEILDGDDWIVVNLNGERFSSGHSFSNWDLQRLLEKIGGKCTVKTGHFGNRDKKWL